MFTRRQGAVHAEFVPEEIKVLKEVIRAYLQIVQGQAEGFEEVRARLFPSANPDDEKVEAAYAELAHDDLASHKVAAAEAVLGALPRRGGMDLQVPEDEIEPWLVLLTDLRLTIGTRLGVTEETMEADFDPREPKNRELTIFHWLGGIQETLVLALDPLAEGAGGGQ